MSKHYVTRALNEYDLQTVGNFIRDMFDDIDVSLDLLQRIAQHWHNWKHGNEGHGENWTTAAGPAIWIKARLQEFNAIPHGAGKQANDEAVSAVMHCFFLSLEETQEMLDALRADKTKISDNTARSKLPATQQHVHPIDKTASQVAPGEWKP